MEDSRPTLDTSLLFSGPDAPDESELYKCVHCGFCLQVCPTYVETGLETESPRGRIALMKAVNEGRIGMTDTVVSHWDRCIQCRACEIACPSGVAYGNLIEATMAQAERTRKPGFLMRTVSSLAYDHLIPHRGRLRAVVSLARIYQKSGIQALLRRSKVLNVAPSLADLESSMPPIPDRGFQARGKTVPPVGERRARVGMLSGCVMPLLHGPEMDAVVSVLVRNGCEVVVPNGQVCCGAINSHVGDLDTTRRLARKNIDVFSAAGLDAVVVASAGCGARMKEYDHLLKADPEYADRARDFSETVKDIHEFLVDLPFDPPVGRVEQRVTYQDSCHLGNAQRITDAPRQILRSIPGVDLVELPNSGRCCGAGGTYAITERDLSLRVLASKMDDFQTTNAEVLTTANPGCLMQLQYGVADRGLPAQVKYVTDLLDKAYRKE